MPEKIGTVLELDNRFILQAKPDEEYEILNAPIQVLRNKDKVVYSLILTNKCDRVYKAYIKQKVTPEIESEEFMNLVDEVVTTHMNKDDILYGKLKDDVMPEELKKKGRKRERVVCRNIAIFMIEHFIGKQLKFPDIAKHYNHAIERSNIYSSFKAMSSYRTDKFLRETINNIEEELNIIYNNLKEE